MLSIWSLPVFNKPVTLRFPIVSIAKKIHNKYLSCAT